MEALSEMKCQGMFVPLYGSIKWTFDCVYNSSVHNEILRRFFTESKSAKWTWVPRLRTLNISLHVQGIHTMEKCNARGGFAFWNASLRRFKRKSTWKEVHECGRSTLVRRCVVFFVNAERETRFQQTSPVIFIEVRKKQMRCCHLTRKVGLDYDGSVPQPSRLKTFREWFEGGGIIILLLQISLTRRKSDWCESSGV